MIAAAQEVIVVTDSSKFGVRGFSKICDTSQIDKIVTDSQAPRETVSMLEENGIDVLLD
jgi:DeoR family transcriptional regulator of aga operon